jgi:hypothetical protein
MITLKGLHRHPMELVIHPRRAPRARTPIDGLVFALNGVEYPCERNGTFEPHYV